MMLIVKYSIKQVMILNRKCDKDLVKQVDAMLYGYVSVTRFQGLADLFILRPLCLDHAKCLAHAKRGSQVVATGNKRRQAGRTLTTARFDAD